MQKTLATIFFERASALKDATAVRYREGRGPYRDASWSELAQMIREMASGLAALGLKPKRCAGIMAQTSHLWMASDLAILANGAVSVPVYPTCSRSDVQFILSNSESQIVFVHNEQLLNKVLSVKDDLPDLQKIVLLSTPSSGKSLCELGVDPELVIGLEELQQLGRAQLEKEPDLVDDRIESTTAEDLATIIYTSGTTGTPKGAMLKHSTIVSVLEDLVHIIPLSSADVYLAFLPMSHVLERVCGEFYWMHSGGVCAYAEGIEHVAKNMAEIEPTMILVVPRVLDRIYAKVKSGIQGASGRARRLIEWSLEVAEEMFDHRASGRQPRIGLVAKHYLAEKLVLSKLRSRIGRRLRLVVSGGAPATPEVIKFFNAIGITTLEGYGLTETAAPATVNRAHKIKIGSVGPALPSVAIKLSDDGEIMIKGQSVFTGYYKNPDATKEAFDEGWFLSGDIGVIDSDGYVTITDRKKDIIINAAGKNIAPQRIEAVIKTVPFVTQAIVFGDRKKHLVALLTLDEQAVTEFAREKGFSFSSYEELVGSDALMKFLRQQINQRSDSFADYEKVRRFAVLPRDLSVEAGELTATLKVKRNVVADKYKSLIESLYREEEAPRLVSSKR